MRRTLAGPRLLLRRLREVMAEEISPQERLDKIVVLIAANMVAEVCSIYLLRADRQLELFATEGLNRTAVHRTSLRLGEGLVGLIAAEAEPLNLTDASAHPSFAYKPETGEEIYHSFLGVPVLRAGQTLGVLVVQNRAKRTYTDEEIEALQTTAMVIAEMVAAREPGAMFPQANQLDARRTMQIEGQPLADGVGLGEVVLHEPRVVVTNLIAEDANTELDRLEAAVDKLRLSLDRMLASRDVAHHGEHRDVLEAYRMFANDRGWVRRIEEAIGNGLTAEAAVEKVQNDTRARMMRQTDPYLRERLHDIDDLTNRLLRELVGVPMSISAKDLPKDAIIVARNMGAAELLDYERGRVRGLVFEEAGPTSHATIIARALGIPAVGQVAGVTSLCESGDSIIADGSTGVVQLRPPTDVQNAYAEKVRFRARRQAQYKRLRHRPSVTLDGEEISLMLNAGLTVDLPHLEEAGAAGIGLFRTEIPFMVAQTFPRMREQTGLYENVISAAGERPVVFRTLDIGGDKVLPYLRAVQEENPAMGWRAVRLGLDRPALLRTQQRALLRASAGRRLRLMFPMVTETGEFEQARAILERDKLHLKKHGHDVPAEIKLGTMIEVPSLLFELDELFRIVDFASVGSNDLFHFLTATDRGNPRVAERYDAMSAPFLRVLKTIVDRAAVADVPLSICGEMAGRPLEAMALIALGYRTLSMSPSAIGPVKAMLRKLKANELRARLLPRLEAGRWDGDLRLFLKSYADDQNIPV
ncbi:phosphoenolpyruvate--protein phosphotransferase [Rhodobium gokarnense]|uniref:phosphoenolpyruvate--protein phosphotransferase n=1 Tax=Rhodobium gokarnense TaxID=364296 RepID=A0ABT3H8S7_9HYPH|nr:phosphoenolpyruvate--protein phosphotransferase [Rhodobium gokarnense]MCW2306789.1 phosphotransferase system enzyme I (PtsP) [Rhodobium gokarnense]